MPHRVAAAEEPSRKRLVHHRHGRRFLRVLLRKIAARQHRNAERVEEPWRNNVGPGHPGLFLPARSIPFNWSFHEKLFPKASGTSRPYPTAAIPGRDTSRSCSRTQNCSRCSLVEQNVST